MALVTGLGTGTWIISSSIKSSLNIESGVASPAPAAESLTNEANVPQYEASSHFNPSMAIIVVVLLSTFFFMGFVSVYLRKCVIFERGRDTPSHRAPGTAHRQAIQGLDKATIGSFPVVSFSSVKKLKQSKSAMECTVCLTEFQEQDSIRVLPKCGHSFHLDCIDMWLYSHTTCPLCRRSLLLNSEDVPLADGFSSEAAFTFLRGSEGSGRYLTESTANQGHDVSLTLTDAPLQNEVVVNRQEEETEFTLTLPNNSDSIKLSVQDLEKLEKLASSSATYDAESQKTENIDSSSSSSLTKSTSSNVMHRSRSCSGLADTLKRSCGTEGDTSSSLHLTS